MKKIMTRLPILFVTTLSLGVVIDIVMLTAPWVLPK